MSSDSDNTNSTSSSSSSNNRRLLNTFPVIQFGLRPIEINNSGVDTQQTISQVVRIGGNTITATTSPLTSPSPPPSISASESSNVQNSEPNVMDNNVDSTTTNPSDNHSDEINNNNNSNNVENEQSPFSLTMNLTLNIQHRGDNTNHNGAAAAIHVINDGNEMLDPLLARTRQRVYSMLLVRVALLYFLTVPNFIRKFFEYGILTAAILSFVLLIHLHILFIRSPLTCLDHVKSTWPRHGILRVQIGLDDGDEQLLYQASFAKHVTSAITRNQAFVNRTFPLTHAEYRKTIQLSQLESQHKELSVLLQQYSDDTLNTIRFYPKRNGVWNDPYVVEYSLEYGLLRLSEEMRQHYKVPVMRVSLAPESDTCFGDPLARFMLNNYLGYDDVLIGSIKRLAEHENNRGYVRNVVTGEHFRFVNVWMARTSYLASAFIMIMFTLFVSMLIRYSHQQVFVFVSEFLHTLEMQQPMSRITFLSASLITMILALIGMETIMYEFFADSSITFHVIIMVWAADQFDSMAVRSPISRRHFLRFFYLYQFAFYAYHYRFNGQYAGLSLLTTMLFSYHSMIFFFHHFELPLLQSITRRHTTGNGQPPSPATTTTTTTPESDQPTTTSVNT